MPVWISRNLLGPWAVERGPRLVKHRLKHLVRESPSKGILLAGMVGSDKGHAIGQWRSRTVPKTGNW